MHTYHVYILTNVKRNVMYIGVTNNLENRIAEHRSGKGGSFTRQYRVHTSSTPRNTNTSKTPSHARSSSKAGGVRRRMSWSSQSIPAGPTCSMTALPKVPRFAAVRQRPLGMTPFLEYNKIVIP